MRSLATASAASRRLYCSEYPRRTIALLTLIGLFLGIITTISISWFLIPWIRRNSATMPYYEWTQNGEEIIRVSQEFGFEGRLYAFSAKDFETIKTYKTPPSVGPPKDHLPIPAVLNEHSGRVAFELVQGWPFYNCYCYVLQNNDSPPKPPSIIGSLGESTWSLPQAPCRFPYLPLWRGLILNVCVFSSLWFVIMFIGGICGARLRPWLRRKQGKCAACGYLLVGNIAGRCPECGMRFDQQIVPLRMQPP